MAQTPKLDRSCGAKIRSVRANGRHRLLATTALGVVFTLAMEQQGHAADWLGTVSNSWYVGGNWSTGTVPGSADEAHVDTTTHIPVIDQAGTVTGGARIGLAGTGQVTVTGPGTWDTSQIILGESSTGNGTLLITNGGKLTQSNGPSLGVVGSLGKGTATITGTGSNWTLDELRIAGNNGSTGFVTISDHGSVNASTVSIGADGTGEATVTGQGSSLQTGVMSVGYNSSTAMGTLTISNGASVQSGSGGLGTYIGAFGTGEVLVTGAHSNWTEAEFIALGNAGSGNGTMTISDGASVESPFVFIGQSGQGDVTVTGANSVLTAKDPAFPTQPKIILGGGDGLGNGTGSVGSLTIAAGGRVSTDASVSIADEAGAIGTINIGAPDGQAAAAPGTLDAPSVTFGPGIGKLVFNHTATDYVFAPVISSTGSTGEVDVLSGTTTLTATNTYVGPTNVNGGVLLVDGSTASSTLTTVNTGGTLGGTGTVGKTSVEGGTLAPGHGHADGTLNVQGDLTFSAGSTYKINLTPTSLDRAVVSGIATLGGATVNASFGPGSYVNLHYDILSATGGIVGTFGGIIGNAPAGSVSLDYSHPNDVILDVILGFTTAPVYTTLNTNQRNVADALNNYFNSTGGIPGEFFSLSPQGLSQASGELATGSQQATFDAMNMFMGIMTDPFVAGRSSNSGASANAASQYADEAGALNYAANGQRRSKSERDAYAAVYRKAPIQTFDERWSVWGAGYGGSQTTNGNTVTGSNTTTSSVYGGVAGADYHLSPDTLIGFALAGGGTNFSVANSGSGRSDLFQAGAFLRHEMGPAYITAAMAYGWQNITTDRTVTAAGVDRLHASFDANAFSGRVESGYRFVSPAFGGIGWTPYAAGQVTLFNLPSYTEQALSGSNTFALSYASKDATATRSELGLRADQSFMLADAILTLRGGAAWAHNFDPDHSIGATFQTLPGASFVVNGAAQANDSALVTASAETKWLNGWSIAGTFQGEFSSVTNSYAGKGVVRYAW